MKKHLLLVLANELRLGLTALVASARSSEAFEATSVLEEYGILQPQARGWKRAAQKSLRVAYVAYPLWHETQLLFAILVAAPFAPVCCLIVACNANIVAKAC